MIKEILNDLQVRLIDRPVRRHSKPWDLGLLLARAKTLLNATRALDDRLPFED
jgi:hypothetical protein